ncbi:MAG TPA: abscisic acid-deficient protein Aba4 family protein, partial [Longimicrobiales bacterium]|nr:abscisic acid-deficient protein Aba4 family protein [Longimicrobiales bacterium]
AVADFGSAEGVVRLLSDPDVALVAWIHLLAFDHLVGVFIFRDNLQNDVVPVPVQSILLFLTLMFGPAGFLTYWIVRVARGRGTSLISSVEGQDVL